MVKTNLAPFESLCLVSETTMNCGINNDVTGTRLPTSTLMINYSSCYGVTQPLLTLVQEVKNLRNYQLSHDVTWLLPLHLCDDVETTFETFLWTKMIEQFTEKKAQRDHVYHMSEMTRNSCSTYDPAWSRRRRPTWRKTSAEICIHDWKVMQLHKLDCIQI